MASVTLSARQADGRAAPQAFHKSLEDIRSEAALGRAVDLLKLDRDPEFNGGEASWLKVAGEILSGSGADATDGRHRAIRHLARSVGLKAVDGKPDAQLLVRASTEDKAMKIAEAIAVVYAAATETTGSVPDKGPLEAVEKAEADLADFRAKAGAEPLAAALVLRNRLAGLERHRGELAEKAAAGRSYGDVTLDDVIHGRLGADLQDAGLDSARQAYTAARLQLDQLSVSLGPKHPQLLAARGEVDKARQMLQARLARLKQDGNRGRDAAKATLASLDADRATLAGQLSGTGIDLARYDQLSQALDDARGTLGTSGDVRPTLAAGRPIFDASVPAAIRQPQELSIFWRSLLGGISGLGAALALALALRPRRDDGAEADCVTEIAPADLGMDKDMPVAVKAEKPVRAEPALAPPLRAAATQRPARRQHVVANSDILAGGGEPAGPEPLAILHDLPVLEKLRRVAPSVFADEQDRQEIERLRGQLAELKGRVLLKAAGRV